MNAALTARKLLGSMLPPRLKSAIGNVPHYLEVARYSVPNPVRPAISISTEARGWLQQMRETGCVRIENDDTRAVADYAERNYFTKLAARENHDLTGGELGDPRLFTKSYNIDYFKQYGTKVGVYFSYKDAGFDRVLRNPDIAGMLYNYFRRQPYYRNQPALEYIDNATGVPVPHGDEYHVDAFHQVSAMLLCTDQTKADTHMEYVPRSHKRSLIKTGIALTYQESTAWAARSQHEIVHLTGKKGTLYVFDTTGIHCRRMIPGSRRKIVHLTWTTGHHVATILENRDNWPELQSSPAHVQRMFGNLA